MSEPYGCSTIEDHVMPLTGVRLEGEILGRGAKFTLHQRFKNMEAGPVEAVYRFPLPEAAVLCGFEARSGDRVVKGFIEEREKAFEMYDDALEKGDGGYLLDRERPNIFTLSVGNLNPGQEVLVILEYGMLLDMDGPHIRLFVPTTIAPRYVPPHTPDQNGIPETEMVNPPFADHVPWGLSMSICIHGGKALAAISSSTHPVQLDFRENAVVASFTSDSVRMDRDFILYMKPGALLVDRAFYTRFQGRGFIQLDLYSGLHAPLRDPLMPSPVFLRDTVFVLDCSGSMTGDSMEAARRALEILLRAMTPGSRFNIYRFGSRFESLFPGPAVYGEKSLVQGLDYLSSAQADLGGTEIMAPLKDMLCGNGEQGDVEKDIILLTDGEVGNEQELFRLLREEGGAARMFAVGIGAAPNEHLVKGLARFGRGACAFVHPGEPIEPKVLALFQKIRSSTIENPVIQWCPSGNGVEQAPAEGRLFENEPATFLARLASDVEPPEAIVVTARVNGESVSKRILVENTEVEIVPIPLLWAGKRIGDLEEQQVFGSEKGSRQQERKTGPLRDAVISLSRFFGIISRYTSFVAMEERSAAEKSVGAPLLRRIPVPVAIGWHGMGSLFGRGRYGAQADSVIFSVSEPRVGGITLDVPTFCRSCSPIPEPSSPSFLRSGSSAPDTADGQNILLQILSLQKVQGGMEMDKAMAQRLNYDLKKLKTFSRSIQTEKMVDRFLLLSTAILLRLLEVYFADQRQQWEGVVMKSRMWVNEMLARTKPSLEDEALLSWVERAVKNKIFRVEKGSTGFFEDRI